MQGNMSFRQTSMSFNVSIRYLELVSSPSALLGHFSVVFGQSCFFIIKLNFLIHVIIHHAYRYLTAEKRYNGYAMESKVK